ncbi:unnamed protein product [Knipowitschia caucasica]
MTSKLKWFIFIQMLLVTSVSPYSLTNHQIEDTSSSSERNHVLLWSQQERSQAAGRVISQLKEKFQGQNQDYLGIQGRVSCKELTAASTMDDSLSYNLPRELLGLSLVPVLVVANCEREALVLVQKLYELLGMSHTDQLLLDLEQLMEKRLSKMATSAERNHIEQNMDLVMFNIRQLAQDEDSSDRCNGWIRLNRTMLIGSMAEGSDWPTLEEALRQCEHLGGRCVGVTHTGRRSAYRALLRKGSRILPSDSESWVQRCQSLRNRVRRSSWRSCTDATERRVYGVVQWIPGVSTLYNLGTAVYYASLHCTHTARERAILSAVDLGTDALMVVTGGAAGGAGYALGVGLKTGVKAGVRFMMTEEDDILVNQFRWDDSVAFQP